MTVSDKSGRGGARAQSPGPGRPTREQSLARQQQLLDVALQLFAEQGFERTTMEGIAAAVGMAKRTVYALYPEKFLLFRAALQRAIELWILPVTELQALEDDDLEASLLAMGQRLVNNILTPEGLRLLRITNAESGRMPEISLYTYEQGTRPTLDYLTDLFARRLSFSASGEPSAADAALAFLSLVVGGPASMSAWGVPLTQAQINRQTRINVRVFLHGLISSL